MTTTNSAVKLRAALKEAGFSARQVTVRQHSSTLHVTVRDSSVSLTRVSVIAGAFESVQTDHKTGEILCGGNTYIKVGYLDALVAPLTASILATLESTPLGATVRLPGGFAATKPLPVHGSAYCIAAR
jgi:hypothetical protein